MSQSPSKRSRRAYEAEQAHLGAIHAALQAQVGRKRIDFGAARDRELASFVPSTPSELTILRAEREAKGAAS